MTLVRGDERDIYDSEAGATLEDLIRPLWCRGALIGLTLATLLLIGSDFTFGSSSDPGIYPYCFMLQVGLIVLVPVWPVTCSAALICTNTVVMFLGYYTGFVQWGGMLATAALGLCCNYLVTLSVCTIEMIVLCLWQAPTLNGTIDIVGLIAIEAMLLCCAVAGIIARRHHLLVLARQLRKEHEEREAQERQRWERRYHDILMASRLHDAVSGPLSVALRQTQYQLRTAQSDEQKRSWQRIHDVLTEESANVGKLIDQLQLVAATDAAENTIVVPIGNDVEDTDGEKEDRNRERSNVQTVEYSQRIAQLMELRDQECAHLGIAGHGTCRTMHEAGWSEESFAQTRDLLCELYANLKKHGQPGRTRYEIVVRCEKNAVDVSELCRVVQKDDADAPDHGSVAATMNDGSGHGIALHAERIRMRGGSMQFQTRPGAWTCHASIPHKTTISHHDVFQKH